MESFCARKLTLCTMWMLSPSFQAVPVLPTFILKLRRLKQAEVRKLELKKSHPKRG